LKLENVFVHHSRLEEMGAGFGRLDWISLQGVAFTADLLKAIRRISLATTRVVWITSDPAPPIPPAERLVVPSTNTQALIFRLDLT